MSLACVNLSRFTVGVRIRPELSVTGVIDVWRTAIQGHRDEDRRVPMRRWV